MQIFSKSSGLTHIFAIFRKANIFGHNLMSSKYFLKYGFFVSQVADKFCPFLLKTFQKYSFAKTKIFVSIGDKS